MVVIKFTRQVDSGGYVLINTTVDHDVLTYTDEDFLSGTIEYYVVAIDANSVSQQSGNVKFANTQDISSGIVSGVFGDGSDGVFTGGGR